MSVFDLAYSFVQKWEGGSRFTMDPDDPGGATKFGISYRFLEGLPLSMKDINKDDIFSWRDVQKLEDKKAKEIFKKYFWDTQRLSWFPDCLAVVMFDTSVNLGRFRTAKYLQTAISTVPDGIIGPITLDTLKTYLKVIIPGERILIDFILERRIMHYENLRDQTDWGNKYFLGWMNRVNDLKEFIKTMPKEA